MAQRQHNQQITKMNIRKKILFNPSHIKSSKPDTSDTTTAHTKNSAILQQSKTFRFSNQQTISTRRQRNYLRTLSKDPKDKDLSYNHASVIKKRNIIIPSFSTMSNENFMPVRKSALGRKFLMEQDELPQLVSLKRTDLMTSQKERKLFNYPSSVHVSSNKEIFAREQIKKQPLPPSQQESIITKPQPQIILGEQIEEIERRKQKLNSFNVASFYTTQKSIALSKYSMKSKDCNQTVINSGKRSSEFGEKNVTVSRFGREVSLECTEKDQVKPSPNKGQQKQEEEMEESIVEQIQKNQSVVKKKEKENKKLDNSSNEWNETLKSSFTDQSQAKDMSPKEFKKQNSDHQQSSLCESQVINSQEVMQRKNTHRNQTNTQENKTKTIDGEKNAQQRKQQKESSKSIDSQESSLCQSYQIETPQKKECN